MHFFGVSDGDADEGPRRAGGDPRLRERATRVRREDTTVARGAEGLGRAVGREAKVRKRRRMRRRRKSRRKDKK